MKAIDLIENWYQTELFPALSAAFPDELGQMAIGVAGPGSECFGFDDEISRDHDFGHGVSIWLDRETEHRIGFQLERFYRKVWEKHAPAWKCPNESCLGGRQHGVEIIDDFFSRELGFPGVPQSWREWLYTPDYAFAEALNGRVFFDGRGTFSAIRNELASGMPNDVRLKKLAARASLMAQSGQYNFNRCLAHGEKGAAALALGEFVRECCKMVFTLNGKYAPYYKWVFRSMRQLETLPDLADTLEFLLTEPAPEGMKSELVEDICRKIVLELERQQLTSSKSDYLETHAMELMNRIVNQEIASLHPMEG